MLRSSRRSLAAVADVGGPSFHVGDEAMLAANVGALGRHDPAADLRIIGRAAAGERLAEAVAVLDEVDGLLVSGGGNLSGTWPELLEQRLTLMREARRRDLPVVTGGQTIGPGLSGSERAALGEALAGVQQLGVRELPSAALALELGAPPDRLVYQPDDAFFLAGRPPAAAAAAGESPYLALTLDPSFTHPEAAGGLRSLAAQLAAAAAESGLRIVFVPHLGPLGALGEGDGAAGAALRGLLAARGVDCTLLPVMPPAETVWVTQGAAAVVASRYHALVFASAAAVPALGVHRDAYTRIKLEGALAQVLPSAPEGAIGVRDCCLSAAAAQDGALLAAFRRLWSGRDGARRAMQRARPALQARDEERWRLLLWRLGWARGAGDGPEGHVFAAPESDVVGGALAALLRERAAGDEAAARARPAVARAAGPRVTAAAGRSGAAEAVPTLSEAQWGDYARLGFLRLGRLLDEGQLEALRRRADELALGRVRNPGVQMQLDTGGAYDALPAATDRFEEGTILYRKIQGLETDELFASLVRHPLFLEISARVYGPHAPVSIFRAMVMNKPAGQGTSLPWHQDGGDVWALDRDPLVTVWVAIDAATRANGCVEVVPGSHHLGLLSAEGSTLSPEHVERHCPPASVQALEVEAGHALLMHNWLIHRSGVNPTSGPRRAFTACYMDGRTLGTLSGRLFPLVAGAPPADAPFLRQVGEENRFLRTSMEEATAYARSLEAEVERLREMRAEAERYALSLEEERRRLQRS